MGANDAAEMLEVAKQECVRLERENRALREAVSLPDRETLVKAIASVSEHDPDTHDFISPEKAADAVLAALSTQPEVGEVEWGIRFHSGTECRVSSEKNARFEAEGIGVVVKRTLGPWIESEPEPQPTELANLFPGTLAALDNLSIRPEVQ